MPAEPQGPSPARGLRTYYVLVATQTVSRLGSRISFFAVGIAVFMQTAHATPIAIIAFCQIAAVDRSARASPARWPTATTGAG